MGLPISGSLILAIGGIIMLSSYVGAMVVALTRMKDCAKPARLLLAGLLIWALSYVGAIGFNMALTRFVTPSQMGTYAVLMSLGQSVLHVLGLGLVVAAVFADRTPETTAHGGDYLPGDNQNPPSDQNPFASPR